MVQHQVTARAIFSAKLAIGGSIAAPPVCTGRPKQIVATGLTSLSAVVS